MIRRHERDWPRGLIVWIQIFLLSEKGRFAFDATRRASRRMFPTDGNVFRVAYQVWTLVIVRGQIAPHGLHIEAESVSALKSGSLRLPSLLILTFINLGVFF